MVATSGCALRFLTNLMKVTHVTTVESRVTAGRVRHFREIGSQKETRSGTLSAHGSSPWCLVMFLNEPPDCQSNFETHGHPPFLAGAHFCFVPGGGSRASHQRILQFLHSLLALTFRQSKLHQPEVFPGRSVFERFPPTTSQNLDDRPSDDERRCLCENIKSNCILPERVWH